MNPIQVLMSGVSVQRDESNTGVNVRCVGIQLLLVTLQHHRGADITIETAILFTNLIRYGFY